MRAALDWSFSPNGDGSVGVALTAAAVPLWIRLSLLSECGRRAKQALGALRALGTHDLYDKMRLQAALGASTPEAQEMGRVFTEVLDIAESLGDPEYQLRALRGLYYYYAGTGQYHAALPIARRFHDLAVSGVDPIDRLFAERMMGVAKHFVGDHLGARRHLEHVLTHYVIADYGRDVIRFQDVVRFGADLQVSTRLFLARVLWMQGFADQAEHTIEMAIAEAQATGHAMSVCLALGFGACPIALWTGDLTAAARHTEMLLNRARKHDLPFYSALGSRFGKIVTLTASELDLVSLPPLTDVDEITEPSLTFRFLTGLSELAEALAHAGRNAEALAVAEEGIKQSETGWLAPELLRVKGELLLLQSNGAATETAEDFFRQALDAARQHKALSWELRAVTSLARLLRNQNRHADAVACLKPVYDRFTEGFGTADLTTAKRLLDELSEIRHR